MYSTLSISNETQYNISAAMALVNSEMVAPPSQLWEDVSEDIPRRDPLYVVIPITIVFVIIFLTGMIGNISTCIVIAKNKYMHTATNYYLFSLAISDLLLLVSGLPQEMHSIWYRYPYLFGEVFCILQGFAAETSANATVLTITAFTVERYVAICHPLRSHTLSRLSRAVKLVLGIWVAALLLAVPQAIQFGIVIPNITTGGEELSQCTTKRVIVQHAFEISTFVFFVLPMTIITVLYILIGLRLRSSRALTRRTSSSGGSDKTNNTDPSAPRVSKSGNSAKSSQNHVIKMLVAVVAAFFICWAPFHAQRLLAVYGGGGPEGPSDTVRDIYHALTYVSGVLYYLSTTVNPVLYHIMSNKFRDAFKHTISTHCGWGPRSSSTKRTYSVLSAHQLARNGSHAAATVPPLRMIRAASVYNNPSPPPESPQHEPLLVTVVEEGAENGGIVTKLQREKTICFRSASVDTSASSLDTAAETANQTQQPDVVRYLGTIEKERISR